MNGWADFHQIWQKRKHRYVLPVLLHFINSNQVGDGRHLEYRKNDVTAEPFERFPSNFDSEVDSDIEQWCYLWYLDISQGG